MNNKEKYIKYTLDNYDNEAKDLILEQIELFYQDTNINKNKYEVGEDVFLKKGTHIHGIPGLKDNFDWIVKNGFIGNDFTNKSVANKIKSSIIFQIVVG